YDNISIAEMTPRRPQAGRASNSVQLTTAMLHCIIERWADMLRNAAPVLRKRISGNRLRGSPTGTLKDGFGVPAMTASRSLSTADATCHPGDVCNGQNRRALSAPRHLRCAEARLRRGTDPGGGCLHR